MTKEVVGGKRGFLAGAILEQIRSHMFVSFMKKSTSVTKQTSPFLPFKKWDKSTKNGSTQVHNNVSRRNVQNVHISLNTVDSFDYYQSQFHPFPCWKSTTFRAIRTFVQRSYQVLVLSMQITVQGLSPSQKFCLTASKQQRHRRLFSKQFLSLENDEIWEERILQDTDFRSSIERNESWWMWHPCYHERCLDFLWHLSANCITSKIQSLRKQTLSARPGGSCGFQSIFSAFYVSMSLILYVYNNNHKEVIIKITFKKNLQILLWDPSHKPVLNGRCCSSPGFFRFTRDHHFFQGNDIR